MGDEAATIDWDSIFSGDNAWNWGERFQVEKRFGATQVKQVKTCRTENEDAILLNMNVTEFLSAIRCDSSHQFVSNFVPLQNEKFLRFNVLDFCFRSANSVIRAVENGRTKNKTFSSKINPCFSKHSRESDGSMGSFDFVLIIIIVNIFFKIMMVI